MARLRFRRHTLPVGGTRIPLLVASEDGEPRAVFLSYEAYLELVATLFTAIAALREAGIDPALLEPPEVTGPRRPALRVV